MNVLKKIRLGHYEEKTKRMPYPTKPSTIEYMNKPEYAEVVTLIESIYTRLKAEYKAIQLIVEAERIEGLEQFRIDVFEELNLPNNEESDILYEKAWEEGFYWNFEGVFKALKNLIALEKCS